MEKDFYNWSNLKQRIHSHHTPPTFKEREIWWCHIGTNIGFEQDGKHEDFNRPVLILKKFNRHIFWGVPLTTKIKDNPYYYKFRFHKKDQCAMISQLRLWDSKRLSHHMGRLPNKIFDDLRTKIKDII